MYRLVYNAQRWYILLYFHSDTNILVCILHNLIILIISYNLYTTCKLDINYVLKIFEAFKIVMFNNYTMNQRFFKDELLYVNCTLLWLQFWKVIFEHQLKKCCFNCHSFLFSFLSFPFPILLLLLYALPLTHCFHLSSSCLVSFFLFFAFLFCSFFE